MKIKKVILENFRAYREKICIDFDDMTVLIGQNDVGKSSWLEALDIFFEAGVVKVEPKDSTIKESETFFVTVVFAPPEKIVIDAQATTVLSDEFLLNADADLEIKRCFKNGKAGKTFIVANHPTNKELKGLISQKIDELKDLASKLGVKDEAVENKTKSASWRKAIRDAVELEFGYQEIDIEGAKDIWAQIEKQFPVYSLFQSDRKNIDTDNEVQDPLKAATKIILAREEIKALLGDLETKVKLATEEISNKTLEKLNEMNPELAKHLHADFDKPKWDLVFKPFIDTDDGVPLNKRGSGVRRMILLNFLRAEAERKAEGEKKDLIYAIEEPETSQHPFHQRMMIEALLELSKRHNIQVIITTHSPQLIKDVGYKNIRFIAKTEDKARQIISGEKAMQMTINELGELPRIDGGYLFCVEGQNDVSFFRNVAGVVNLFDLNNIPILPLNGGFIKKWAEEHYLENTDVKEFHLYDRDNKDERYKATAEKVSSWPNAQAVITKKREIENYVHPSLINDKFGLDLVFDGSWDDKNIPKICADRTGEKEEVIKEIICGELSVKMTKDFFEEIEAWDEVRGWFEQMNKLALSGSK